MDLVYGLTLARVTVVIKVQQLAVGQVTSINSFVKLLVRDVRSIDCVQNWISETEAQLFEFSLNSLSSIDLDILMD